MTTRPGSSPDRRSTLIGRDQKIVERVRRALHLSPSMSLDEVAEQFRHSAAWRRERLDLVGEEGRDGLGRVIRSLLQSLWGRVQAGWTWLWGDETSDSSGADAGGRTDRKGIAVPDASAVLATRHG